jgi:hypothetical protein
LVGDVVADGVLENRIVMLAVEEIVDVNVTLADRVADEEVLSLIWLVEVTDADAESDGKVGNAVLVVDTVWISVESAVDDADSVIFGDKDEDAVCVRRRSVNEADVVLLTRAVKDAELE